MDFATSLTPSIFLSTEEADRLLHIQSAIDTSSSVDTIMEFHSTLLDIESVRERTLTRFTRMVCFLALEVTRKEEEEKVLNEELKDIDVSFKALASNLERVVTANREIQRELDQTNRRIGNFTQILGRVSTPLSPSSSEEFIDSDPTERAVSESSLLVDDDCTTEVFTALEDDSYTEVVEDDSPEIILSPLEKARNKGRELIQAIALKEKMLHARIRHMQVYSQDLTKLEARVTLLQAQKEEKSSFLRVLSQDFHRLTTENDAMQLALKKALGEKEALRALFDQRYRRV